MIVHESHSKTRDNRLGFATCLRGLHAFKGIADASTILNRCATVHFKGVFFVREKRVGSFKSRFPRRGVLIGRKKRFSVFYGELFFLFFCFFKRSTSFFNTFRSRHFIVLVGDFFFSLFTFAKK